MSPVSLLARGVVTHAEFGEMLCHLKDSMP
jgi:hypothetical protein